MKQLFVVHTQYNLILACGVSQEGRKDDLILFSDFKLTEQLKSRLSERFNRCLFLPGNFPKRKMTVSEKLRKISDDNRALRSFMTSAYDRLFVVDDMCIQEMVAMKQARHRNPSAELAWLEDGTNAYFSNGVVSVGMGATVVKRFIRAEFFTLRFGLYGYYDLAACMGGHKKLTRVYATYPEQLRRELRSKHITEITQAQLCGGMGLLYRGEAAYFEENSILFAMDILNAYGDQLEKVNAIIGNFERRTSQEGRKVYCKYHPKETGKLTALQSAEELDRNIALESYLTNASTKAITVIGIKSTALMTAKKMGYEAVSLIRMIDEESDRATTFYELIGITCK